MLSDSGGPDVRAGGQSSELELLRAAIAALHQAKDAAYGPAWKKRGELISIVANIARKVDRLEHMRRTGNVGTPDEGLLDTAVDLYVYSLKYLTYLADLDEHYARAILPDSLSPPYSEGCAAFEQLHVIYGQRHDLTGTSEDAVDDVLAAFQRLEAQLLAGSLTEGLAERQRRAEELASAAWSLVGVLATDNPVGVAALAHQYGVTQGR